MKSCSDVLIQLCQRWQSFKQSLMKQSIKNRNETFKCLKDSRQLMSRINMLRKSIAIIQGEFSTWYIFTPACIYYFIHITVNGEQQLALKIIEIFPTLYFSMTLIIFIVFFYIVLVKMFLNCCFTQR